MKNLKRKIKKSAQKIMASFLLVTTVMWSFGASLMTLAPVAEAAGGINVMYVNDAGATPDTFLDDLDSQKAFLEINIFEETGGTLNSVSVCLDEMNGFNPTTDLTALTLWQDAGEDNVFEPGSGDTLLSTVSSYTALADTYAMGGTCPQATFSLSPALTIPASTSQIRLFVAAQAKANLNETPMRSFNPMIPVGGIDVTVSGASIADWPSGMNAMFPPVFLGTEGTGMMGSPLLISEIQTAGGDGDDEFIELYNRSPEPIVLSAENSFTLTYEAAASEQDLETKGNWDASVVLNSGTIPANGFMLIGGDIGNGYDGSPTANATFVLPASLPTDGGIIGLFGLFNSTDNIVDKVAYGNAVSTQAEGDQVAPAPEANKSIERKAFPDSTASKMAADGIHELKGNGEDSNNNAMDFIVTTTSVPQNLSSTAESFGGGFDDGGSTVIINEVFYNTDSTTGWIELYNRSGESQVMDGWKIVSNTKTYTIPDSTSIAAGAFAVVYWNATGTNTATDLYTSNSSTLVNGDMGIYGGDVILKDNLSAIKDYVQYGGSGFENESTANTEGEWMVGDYVLSCLYGQSIGRRSIGGEDFNSSGDWQIYSSPSPSFSNMGGDSTAPTAVSSVALTDSDNTIYGIDGNDITMTWTPASAPDPSFDRYEIYLLPATTAFDGDAHSPIDYIYGGQYYNGDSSVDYTYVGGGFINKDSAGTTLSAASYIAYVRAVDFAGNSSSVAVSNAYSLSSVSDDSAAGVDEQKPFIMHMGVWQAKAGADITLLARFQDDRGLGTVPGAGAQVVYKTGSTWQTAVNCSVVAINSVNTGYYTCVIPSAAAVVSTQVSYYLKSADAAGNIGYISASAENDMASGVIDEVTIKTAPFIINIVATSNYEDDGTVADLSGYVYGSDGSVFADNQQPKLFLEGTGIGVVDAANTTGAFTFADNLLAPGSYNLVAFKDGYMDMFLNVFKNESVNVYLNSGDMNMMSGTDMPFVTWTAPGEGMMGASTDIYCTGDCGSVTVAGEMPVLIGFSKPMNANTINDLDASNAGSNIYLTTNGNDRVSGKVYYDSIMNEARFYTSTHNVLLPNTFYNIVVTQGVTDEDGNPIGGNTPDGSFSSGFVTMGDNTDFWTGDDYTDYGTSGMMMPPYVQGTTPNPGAYNVSPNSSIMVEFSEPMDSTSINNTSIKLYPVTDESAWTLGSAIAATVTLDQTTQRVATLDPSVLLETDVVSDNGWYVIEVMGSVKSTAGIWFGDPSVCETDPDTCLSAVSHYANSFQVSSTSDVIPPTLMGTAVDVGIAGIEIGFSEPMNAATITAQNITLASGSSSVTGTVKYDPMSNMAKFIPSSALNANTQYTLTISTSVTDLAGVAIVAATISFKTGTADTTSPTLMYANGDDYMLAVTYSEPMNSAGQTNTTRWGTSVLNPANYFVKTLSGVSDVLPYSSATVLSSISGLNFTYDEMGNTVTIEGFDFFVSGASPSDFQIFIDLVTDRSNNIITNSTNHSDISLGNAAQGPIQNSTDTYGMLAPGTYDPMMDMGDMGMMMAGAFPMNGMAGQTSMYFIDVPTAKSIPAGGTIMLTFPNGFDVSNADKDLYSPINDDINEWNAGTITIASVAKDQASRTVTITTGGVATQATDFLHMDIKGIVNSSIPKDFGTEGYLVDIKTFSDTGALLESITTMPFFLTQGGSNTISGTITAADATTGTMTVYLGSPMTGPMEATSSVFSAGSATYSFAGLPDGEYHIFTEPTVTINSINYFGNPMPEPIWVSGSDATKNIVLEKEGTSGTAVTINLTGDFSTNSVADDVDIFAGSPSGFRVKTLTNVGDQNGSTDYTLYLPDGDWMVGIGPAMPMGPMSGPPPMPDWMPPMPTNVKVVNPAVTENSGIANDGTISFDISSQVATTVSGTVTNGAGSGIADAEVYAYQPMGGFGGAFTKTATDGSFVLKVPVKGTYVIGAYKPGLPSGPEQSVNVQANVTDLSLVLQMPSYTISGKVLNSNSQAVAYAPVWAYQPNGWGHADTMTDAAGNYILYVDNGTWQVEADAPGVGWMQYDRLITIDSASQSDTNLKPDTDTLWKTISGTVTIGGDTQNYRPIRAVAYDANGNYLGREYSGMTDSSGNYAISVPGIASGSKYYRVDIWTPDYGEVAANDLDGDGTPNEAYPVDDKVENSPANVIVGNSDVSNVDVTILTINLKSTLIQFDNKDDYSGSEAFINIDGVTCTEMTGYYDCIPTGFHKSIRISDISGADPTVSLATGDYFFFVDVPGVGHYIPKSDSPAFDTDKGCIVVDGTSDTVQFALPDLDGAEVVTVSGTISGPVAGQMDAWVWIGNPETGFHSGGQAAAADGSYSMIVPKLSSGNYFVGADKQGFLSSEPTSIAGTETIYTVNITLAAQSSTISGKIYADANSNSAYDSGEEIPNGWVHAENISTGARTHAPVDGSGTFSLGVVNGIWKVFGMANGYSESQYRENNLPATLTVFNGDLTGKNIELNVNADWANMTKSSPMTPSSGGVIDDTAQNTSTGKASGTGVKLTVPPNALGSSTSSGTVATSETSAVSATNSMKPFADKGKNITATDNSGQPITNLDNYIDMEMIIYRADVIANTEMTDLTKLKTLKVGYWDDTLSEWVNLATTKTAYYKADSSSEWTVYNGTITQSGFKKFIDDALGTNPTFVYNTDYVDYKLVFKASTNHLTVFALGTSPDGLAPAAPAGLAQSVGTGTSNTIGWNAVTANSDASPITDLYGYAVYRSIDDTTYSQISASAILAGTETYTDITTAAFTSYYYKVTAGDDDDTESAYSTAVQMCSNSSVANGTVAVDCTITCSDGYSLSGNSCVSAGGGGGGTTTVTLTGSISINSGATSTASQIVTLQFSSSGATQMAISNSSDFSAISWEAYTVSKEWTLTEGDGAKTVYAKFKNSSGNVSSIVSDTIALSVSSETATEETTGEMTSSEETAQIVPYSQVMDGDIIQCQLSPNPFAVYVVKAVGDTKYIRHIVSLEIFDYYGHLKWENLKQVDSLNNYSLSGWVRHNTGENGTSAATDKVYEINGDQSKHWINMTAEDFLTHGGSESAIYSVNQGELDLYTTGADVMSL